MEFCKILSECLQKLPDHTLSEEYRLASSILECMVAHLASARTKYDEPIHENMSTNNLVETKHKKLDIEEGEMVENTGEVFNVTDDAPQSIKLYKRENSTKVKNNEHNKSESQANGKIGIDETSEPKTIIIKQDSKILKEKITKSYESIIFQDETDKSILLEKINLNPCIDFDDKQVDEPQTSRTEPAIKEIDEKNPKDLKVIEKKPILVEGNITQKVEAKQKNKLTLAEENIPVTSTNRSSKIFPIDFRCDNCPFSLENEAKVGKYTRTKLRKHNRNKHFICEICCEKCEDSKHLKDHMLTIHIGKDGEMFCGVKNCDKKIGKYVAGSNKERRDYEQLYAVIQHRMFVHENSGFVVCKICNSTYRILKEHKLVCNTKYDTSQQLWKSCLDCHKKIKTDRDLMIHKKKVHLKKYPCKSCSYKATTTYNLIKHKATHQEGKVICEKDGCSFVSVPGAFKRHLFEKHGEGKLFRCNFCDYQTYRLTFLNNHEAIHAEVKQIKCSKCDYRTARKDYMPRHESKHQETPKYFCDQCEYKSWDYSNFQVHIKVKHGSDIYECQECDYQSKSSRSFRKHKLKHNHTLSIPNE